MRWPAPLSANALLMAYIGGTTVFGGPILGAVLITLLQSGVSLMSNSWLIYVGVLFIAMVIFAPDRPCRASSWRIGPIVRARPAVGACWCRICGLRARALGMVLGFVGLVELLSFLTIGAAQGKKLALFGAPIDVTQRWPWTISGALPARRRHLAAHGKRAASAACGKRLIDDLQRSARMTRRRVQLRDVRKNFGADARSSAASTWISRAVSAMRSSARTAPARPRCST